MSITLLPLNNLSGVTVSATDDQGNVLDNVQDSPPVIVSTSPLRGFQRAKELETKNQISKMDLFWNKAKTYCYALGAFLGGFAVFALIGSMGKIPIHKEMNAKIKQIYGSTLPPLNHESFEQFIHDFGGDTALSENLLHVGLVRIPGGNAQRLAVLTRNGNAIFSKTVLDERFIHILDTDGKIIPESIKNSEGVHWYGVPMKLGRGNWEASWGRGIVDGWKRIFNSTHASPNHPATKTLQVSELVPQSSGFFRDMLGFWGFDALFDLIFTMFL